MKKFLIATAMMIGVTTGSYANFSDEAKYAVAKGGALLLSEEICGLKVTESEFYGVIDEIGRLVPGSSMGDAALMMQLGALEIASKYLRTDEDIDEFCEIMSDK